MDARESLLEQADEENRWVKLWVELHSELVERARSLTQLSNDLLCEAGLLIDADPTRASQYIDASRDLTSEGFKIIDRSNRAKKRARESMARMSSILELVRGSEAEVRH